VKRASDNWPIKTGYVAFGDSFAAGMGTGTTSTDRCRVGSNNFGNLLYTWTNNPLVQYQQMACSGDTTFGLNRQINEWQLPEIADVATISMGGNDLGFPDLVRYCVIIPYPFSTPEEYNKQKCEVAKTKAKNLMNLSDGSGLQAKLRAAYTKILDKSTRAVSSFNPCDTPSGYYRATETIFHLQHFTNICDRTSIYM
jgi:lysophospholipase L1-like esterase